MFGAKVVMKGKEDEVKDITGNDDQRLFCDLVTGGVKTLELERWRSTARPSEGGRVGRYGL